VLTSRNALLPVRRALATRWPDLVKSNGGGSNAILVRGEWIAEHRVERLAWLPERRRLHAIRTASGLWIANLHAGGTRREARLAAATATAWAGDAPLVLGGDFNIRELALDGFECAGGNGVDHVYVRGLKAAGHTALPDRGELSDHEPVLVNLR
jgi:endonuclease/exonuclease/phosphatase family metal-dependent hydrolase